MNLWPPGCGDDGCLSHLPKDQPGCICPRCWDSSGVHIGDQNPECPAHVVETGHAERSRASMEFTSRALGESRDV